MRNNYSEKFYEEEILMAGGEIGRAYMTVALALGRKVDRRSSERKLYGNTELNCNNVELLQISLRKGFGIINRM